MMRRGRNEKRRGETMKMMLLKLWTTLVKTIRWYCLTDGQDMLEGLL